MKQLLYTILIMLFGCNLINAQEPVLFADLGNNWANEGDQRRNPFGYVVYKADTVYHYIDSLAYTFISNNSTYIVEKGYVRYDSVAGILYGRGYNGYFGWQKIYDSTGTTGLTDEFVLMRKGLNIGDTVRMDHSFEAHLNGGSLVVNVFVVKDIINLKPQYGSYLDSFNESIDSIDQYILVYTNYDSIKNGTAFIIGEVEFNFVSGFSNSPFGNLGSNGMHIQPWLNCFWNPTYSDTSALTCPEFIKYMSLSDNSIQYETITIYPNPVEEYIQIKGDGIDFSKQHTIIIYNAMGQQVTKKPLENKDDRIVTRHLSSGLYYINLINNGAVIGSSKFVKQ